MRYPKDLTGQKFDRLTVIDNAEPYIMPNGDKMTRWVCRCDCGKEITVKRRSLVNGDRKSCGCLNLENHESSKSDITGQRFGRLIAIRPADEPYITPSGKKHRRWICRCDCGNEVIVNQKSLLYGTTRSCGCIRQDISETIESEMVGKRFGRLTVLRQSDKMYTSPSGKSRERLWDCKCDCGNIIYVRRTLLVKELWLPQK